MSDSEVIKISVTNGDSEIAASIANELANVFSEQVKEIYNIDNVHVVDTAEKSDLPSNVNHTKDIMIFALIGIVVSVIYVLLDNMLDTTVKTTEDIERLVEYLFLLQYLLIILKAEREVENNEKRVNNF